MSCPTDKGKAKANAAPKLNMAVAKSALRISLSLPMFTKKNLAQQRSDRSRCRTRCLVERCFKSCAPANHAA